MRRLHTKRERMILTAPPGAGPSGTRVSVLLEEKKPIGEGGRGGRLATLADGMAGARRSKRE